MSKQQSPQDFIELPDAIRSKFTLTDPEKQIGLTVEMEPGAEPAKYLNRYHTNHDVRCAFCLGHTKHRRGFTVQMEDGRIALCGIDCGKKYFGEEAAKGFENALIRTEYEAARDETLKHATSVLPGLIDELIERWLPMEEKLTDIQSILPRFPETTLKSRLNDNGELLVSDFDATWHDLPEGGHKVIESQRELGRVRGARFLAMQGGRFNRALDYANLILSGRDEFSRIVSPESRLRKWNALGQVLKDALHYCRTAETFLVAENIKVLDLACRKYLYTGEKCELRHTPKKQILWVRDANRRISKVAVPNLGLLPSDSEFFDFHSFRVT